MFLCAKGELPECAKTSGKRGVPAGAEAGVLFRAKAVVPDGAKTAVLPGGRPGA